MIHQTLFSQVQKLCFLAMNTSSSTSIASTYILFLTEMQKRQIPENGFALLKNAITKIIKL